MSSAPLLIRPKTAPRRELRWDEAGLRVLNHEGGLLRVLGGPGTGKTTLLVEAVARRIVDRGVDPERILVLTANRRAGQDLRERITERLAELAGEDRGESLRTVREPLVRSVHSYAFAVLRLQATLHGEPPPRLLSGPEQDAMVRELLAGELEIDGGRRWPARLRPALGLPAFAAELRELLLRAAERGLGPEELIELGRDHERPEWVAAGEFFRIYEQVTLLRGSVGRAAPQATAPALDAAELVAMALLTLDTDAEVLERERDRVRHVFVDDAQHLDPLQVELATRLGAPAHEYVLAGDPDQAVFNFRGADPALLAGADPDGRHTVVLASGHRMAPAVEAAVGRLVARLAGSGPQRRLTAVQDGPPGTVQVRLLRSAAAEAAWVADQLRRAHLMDGVPWSQMAVLVRSTVRSLPALRRALLAAGVPVTVPREELPLIRQPAVWPFVALLRAAVVPESIDEDAAVALVGSSLGGADPLALRRLRRGLRRLAIAAEEPASSGELLVRALRDADPVLALDDYAAAPLRRLAGLISAVRDGVAAGYGIEEVLWRVWQASRLERRWSALAARGGSAGAQADRDLDAVLGLFDAAAHYADRLPGAGVAEFAGYLAGHHIPGDSLAPKAPASDAVAVLTAHAAAGREWTVVAVPGVQEGLWPNLRLRGSLLGVERLVDVLAGVDTDVVSAIAPLLAEERRLMIVAASRARRTLLVSAVQDEEEQPSRFLDELDPLPAAGGAAPMDTANDAALMTTAVSAGLMTTAAGAASRPILQPPRGLQLAELVGELRRAVCDPDTVGPRRRAAAAQLARLARAGVPGANPDEWAGLAAPTTDGPLRAPDEPVTVSPSAVELITTCGLRWFLERHGGRDAAELPAVTGILVHALTEAVAAGADEAKVSHSLEQAWAAVEAGAPWFSRREQRRVRDMLTNFRAWLQASRGDLTGLAIEYDVDVTLPAEDGGPPVRIRGRVDRIEQDPAGRPVIVDVKTGRTPISAEAATRHAQLAVYQLAAALGAFTRLGVGSEPGGAALLYLSKLDRSGGPAVREQPPLDAAGRAEWTETVRGAAASTTGPGFTAAANSDCDRCPTKTACPMTDSGRQVT
jgi:superfamily I DNA/RNA helicase/RecB family exonuclease